MPSDSGCLQSWAHHLSCTMACAGLPDLVMEKLILVRSTASSLDVPVVRHPTSKDLIPHPEFFLKRHVLQGGMALLQNPGA